MTGTRRERNLNFIAWPVIDEDRRHGRFTPCRPLEGTHVITIEWVSEEKAAPRGSQSNPADEDIRLGRIKRFSSVDELIEDLDQPE